MMPAAAGGPPAVQEIGAPRGPGGAAAPTLPDVVVVEDHPLQARLLIRALGRRMPGCRIERFADGEAAARRLLDPAAPTPTLVVLDLELPGRTGHELLEHRGRDARLAGVPVVVVTSSPEAAARERSLALGADLHLEKPVAQSGFATLADALAALIGR